MAAFLYNHEIAKAYQNRGPRQGEIPTPEEAVRCLALFIVPAAWLWQPIPARSASASWGRPQSSRAFLIASPKYSCKSSAICSPPGKIVLMRDEKRNEPLFQIKHEPVFVTSDPCLYSPASWTRIFQQVWKKTDTSSRSYTFHSRW